MIWQTPTERAKLKTRQGVRYLSLEGLDVLDPEIMLPVSRDGKTMGEVMFRGNVVMKDYFRNPKSTQEAFSSGWFQSDDLGVRHPDSYIQLKGRSKGIIISGGENISSIEVELAPRETVDAATLRAWYKDQLAPYKVPGQFSFDLRRIVGNSRIHHLLVNYLSPRP